MGETYTLNYILNEKLILIDGHQKVRMKLA